MIVIASACKQPFQLLFDCERGFDRMRIGIGDDPLVRLDFVERYELAALAQIDFGGGIGDVAPPLRALFEPAQDFTFVAAAFHKC
ncbi:MAG TPA: hypothetical protein VLL57_00695 [Candidatus Binataceae bacterium]|nr:hypothetical protein [Candidatus Binataceae bacterium]